MSIITPITLADQIKTLRNEMKLWRVIASHSRHAAHTYHHKPVPIAASVLEIPSAASIIEPGKNSTLPNVAADSMYLTVVSGWYPEGSLVIRSSF